MEALAQLASPRFIIQNYSSKLISSLKPLSRLAIAVGIALSASSVLAADCSTAVNGKISCTQNTANESLVLTEAGVIAPIYMNAANLAGSEGSATLNITDSNITGIGSSHALFSQGKGAAIIFNGTNSITLGAGDDTAVLVMGNAGSSKDAIITVDGQLDIHINREGFKNSDGLEAHGSNSYITHLGTGTINTNGGNGILTSATNNATVLVNKGAILNIAGNNNDGIRAAAAFGNVDINSNATITTTGDYGFGVRTNINGGSGNIDITNTGGIMTSGLSAHGLYATTAANSTGSGKITINNLGNITTSNANATAGAGAEAIYALVTNPGANSGGVEINQAGGTLKTTGHDSHGIFVLSTALSGDLNVNMSDTIIDLKGQNSDGIDVQRLPTGNVNQVSTVNINITTNGGEIRNAVDNVTAPTARANYGIVAFLYEAAAGNINIINYGTKITTGLGLDGQGLSSAAIDARLQDTTATGHINILNSGDLTTAGGGENTSAIYIMNNGSGETNIINTGNISTTGDGANGIRARSNNKLYIGNTGNITTSGPNALSFSHGISGSLMDAGSLTIVNDGSINIKSLESRGIWVAGADGSTLSVTNNGLIQQDAVSSGRYGIEVLGNNNVTKIINNNGQIIGGNFGIVAWTGFAAHTGGKSIINIGSQGYVDSLNAITADMSDENTINIDHGGHVNGRDLALNLRSQGTATPIYVVNNAGKITSDKDNILFGSFAVAGANLTVNNLASGVMTGVITTNTSNTAINNQGIWNIRNAAYSTDLTIRDTLSVAVSNLGSSGNNHIINSGIINLLGDGGTATILNDTAQYDTGYTANQMALGGPVQGHILSLASFTHSGVIDLTTNAAVGDVLLITGSDTKGLNGNGIFVANGGSLRLDTFLNEGDIDSRSDILVVDNVVAGSNVTQIIINRVGGDGALTSGDGIKVIEVLGDADTGSFALGNVVKSGIYEYTLHEGSVTTIGDKSLYLRSAAEQINPDVGSYLANQTAATGLFMHTLHDRLGEPQYYQNYKAEDKAIPAVWVRAVAGNSKNEAAGGWLKQHSENTLVHLGGELANWTGNGDNRYHLGVMGAYGRSETKTTSKATGSRVNSTIDGYGIGAYLTWYQDPSAVEGWYTDIWSMYNWFNNQTEGSDDYDSQSSTTSIEAGYATKLTALENYDWMLEPQVQAAYNYYSADEIQDHNGLNITDSDANGVATRLGMRTYLRPSTDKNGAQPFVELNWLYNSASNSMIFNGETIADDTPKNRYEAKVGVQGEMTKNLQVYSHIALQWGEHNYQSAQGQVGVRYRF